MKEYPLTKEQVQFYRENNYIKLKNVFDKEIIFKYNSIISEQVSKMTKDDIPLEEKDTYGKAFQQLFNLWTKNDEISELVLDRRLAAIASRLMEVEGVRIYHDQALFKQAGGGITPWHADQYYWPLNSDKTITAWIPLQETPLSMGPLEFSAGSQAIQEGRDLEIGDDSEAKIQERLRVTDFNHIIEPFDIGEVSFHSGWIFHRAGANETDQTRKVMTVIFMDKDMKAIKPQNQGQQKDLETWLPGVQVGETASSKINPVVYP